MPHRALRRISQPLSAALLAVVAAVGAAACGDEDQVDTTKAVESANEQLKPFEVRLSCPETVDQDTSGFDCTVQGVKTGETATVRAVLVGEKRDTVAAADESAFQTAVGQVAR